MLSEESQFSGIEYTHKRQTQIKQTGVELVTRLRQLGAFWKFDYKFNKSELGQAKPQSIQSLIFKHNSQLYRI